MNEEMKKLYEQINAKKAEIRKFVADNKLDEAKNAKKELHDLADKFDILADLEEEKQKNAQQQAADGNGIVAGAVDAAKKQVKAFVNAIKAAWKKTEVAPEDREVLNTMSEGSDEDGGLTVPKDIRTQIKELRRSEDALENLVNVEHVNTNSGSRVIEREADQTPFDNIEEAAEFPEISTPQFDNIDYKIKKKGGILKVTQELLADSAENIIGRLRKWIAKKAKATRNFMIIAKVKEICKDKEVKINSIDDIKDIYNERLDPAIALGAVCITNQSGFNFLDKLIDSNGKYILQPDPTQQTKKLLLGMYPIIKVSNKTLANINGKAPIICGDLKEAITIFDRETLIIDISGLAAGMWEKDQTGIKVRERLDIQTVDEGAVVLGLAEVTDINEDGSYSDAELNKLTKKEILDLGTKLGYTITKTETDTKADIIADFLEQQTAGNK